MQLKNLGKFSVYANIRKKKISIELATTTTTMETLSIFYSETSILANNIPHCYCITIAVDPLYFFFFPIRFVCPYAGKCVCVFVSSRINKYKTVDLSSVVFRLFSSRYIHVQWFWIYGPTDRTLFILCVCLCLYASKVDTLRAHFWKIRRNRPTKQIVFSDEVFFFLRNGTHNKKKWLDERWWTRYE